LTLCADAGLATVGVIAVDGTKVAGNASRDRTLTYEQLAKVIVDEQLATDQADSDRLGERRGDELPESLQPGDGRHAWLRAARPRLERERFERAAPIARSRPARASEATRRLEEELVWEVHANKAYGLPPFRWTGVD
jgi:hypothetical protein